MRASCSTRHCLFILDEIAHIWVQSKCFRHFRSLPSTLSVSSLLLFLSFYPLSSCLTVTFSRIFTPSAGPFFYILFFSCLFPSFSTSSPLFSRFRVSLSCLSLILSLLLKRLSTIFSYYFLNIMIFLLHVHCKLINSVLAISANNYEPTGEKNKILEAVFTHNKGILIRLA